MMQKTRSLLSKVAVSVVVFALPLLTRADSTTSIGGTDLLPTELQQKSGLGAKGLPELVGSVINVFMGLLGTVAVAIILIGGFQWMTAGGNEEKLEKAKKMLGAGVIGLAIVLAAYSITQFVIKSLVTATV